MPIPRVLGQQPLAAIFSVRAAGFWDSLKTSSALDKATAQDAVQLMQVTSTKGWMAGLSDRQAMLLSHSSFRAPTLDCWQACSEPAECPGWS